MARRALDGVKATARRIWRSERQSTTVMIFGALALVLATLGYLVIDTYFQQGSARELLVAQSETLRTVRSATNAALEAETGQRGYLLTGDAEYLEPYRAARRQWPRLLDRLATDDPLFDAKRAELLQLLRRLEQAKTAELERTIELYNAGREQEAMALVRGHFGKTLMDEYMRNAEKYEQLIISSMAADRLDLDLGRARPYLTLAALFVFIMALLGLGYTLERRRASVEVRLRRNREVAAAHEQTALLARELNHRVNNLFSVVLAIVSLAARRHENKDALIRDIRSRIHALSRAHSITQGRADIGKVSLMQLIRTALEPYMEGDASGRVRIAERDIALPARNITPLGLIFHELATNAAKYGALGKIEGLVAIEANIFKESDGTSRLIVCWSEHGASVATGKKGFGTTMMQAAAKQLEGEINVTATEDGIRVELSFLVQGEDA